MSETQVLLGKIAALRQQLEQAHGAANEAGSTAATLLEGMRGPKGIWRLEQEIDAGSQQTAVLDSSLCELSSTVFPPSTQPVLPRQLTARARRVLAHGRELIQELRALAEHPQLEQEPGDPLATRYRETAALADTSLRLVQAFPSAPSAQLHLCDGLEAMLRVVTERIRGLSVLLRQRSEENARIDACADLLTRLSRGSTSGFQPFVSLAEELLDDAQRGVPIRFRHAPITAPARFVACHSLTTAQVLARLVRHDPDLRGRPLEPVLAALVHDVGMLAVPAAAWAHAGRLDDAQRRAIEHHVLCGAELVSRALPGAAWLIEAVAGHHERLDGTGYPCGQREMQISSLARLLAVCDVYAAQCVPRPHRFCSDTRTALAETLLLAEEGMLDRQHAERLLHLSFYPVGSVVELADGAVGVVVATHRGRRDLNTPARPVIALLTDAEGKPVPMACHIDLAQCEGRSIVRTLPPADRRTVLGKYYPEWA